MKTKTLAPRIKKAIEAVAHSEMDRFGLKDIQIREAEDHDGDPVLFVDVECENPNVEVDVKILAGLVGKLRNRLWKMGETRFPHVIHHFPDKQRIRGFG
jgi:hypothetical protein